MTKTELIDKVAKSTGKPKTVVTDVVNSLFEEIGDTLSAHEKVVISGFGTFDVRERKEKQYVTPNNKKGIVPEHFAVGFNAGDPLKEKVK